MVTTEEFVSCFHSLEGSTVAERRRNFFRLLNKTRRSQEDGCEAIHFTNLQPRSPLEERFKIEALIYFRSIPDLFDILKSGNPMYIGKVLKVSNVFIDEAFKNISGEDLVKNIFPCMSFNTKLKVLNKLCLYLKDTTKAEDFFVAICERYGLCLASKLLSCCSETFIMECIKANRIEITPSQLMLIIKRFPGLTECVFDALDGHKCKVSVGVKYHTVFNHFMQEHFSLFLKLNEKYKPEFCLGRRATKCLINIDTQNIVKNSKNIHKLLKKKQVGKSLKRSFNEFFYNLFPTSLNQCENEYKEILSLLNHGSPPSQRTDLLLKTFKKVYNNELWEHPNFVTQQLMEMMSSDERQFWVQTHPRPSKIQEESWISFMKTEKSIPLLKKRISLTSNIKARARVVPYLVKTCHLNNDKAALLDCCKYMVTQHHNDHYLIRQGFLKTIISSYGLERLEEEHWTYVNQLLEYGTLNNDNYYGNSDFQKAYIEYRLTKCLPIENQLEQLVKSKYGRLDMKDPKHQRHYLQKLGQYVGAGHVDDEDREDGLNYEYVDYLSCLREFNKKHPKDHVALPLCIYITAIDHLKIALNKNYYCWDAEQIIQEYIACSNIDEVEKVEILNIFFLCTKNNMSGELVKWLLTYDLSYLLNNITTITKAILRTSRREALVSLWKHFKYYTHLGIPQKICEICKEIFNSADDDHVFKRFGSNKIECAMTALSYLMDPGDFLDFIKPYYPTTSGIDISTNEGRTTCEIQKDIAVSIKNIIPPSVALDAILNFSRGDYLKYVQKSLQSISYNVPEINLSPFLTVLSCRAVSVRKHAICFMFNSSNKADIYSLLTKLMKADANTSISKSLFKGIFNFFTKNPDDFSWDLLKQNVQALHINDNEAFNILVKWKRIPEPYLVPYIIFTWDTLGKLSDADDVEEKRCQIVDAVNLALIPEIPREFIGQIVQNYLFKSKKLSTFQLKIHSFICKYIIYCKSPPEQEDCLKLTFTLMKNYVADTWYNTSACVVGTKSVYNFIQEFCSYFLENKCLNTEIFIKFVDLWNNFQNPERALNMHLYLQFTLKCLEYTTLFGIAEQLIELYSSLLQNYGSIINDSFYKSLQLFIGHFLLSKEVEVAEENRFTLIQNIMEKGSSVNSLIIVIFLLPTDIPTLPKLKVKYYSLIEAVLKEKNPSVQICIRQYLLNKD